MINQEFQRLKGQYGLLSGQIADVKQKMKDNLLRRNGNKDEYTFHYTRHGTVLISRCGEVAELFEIDGDMCPRNL